MKIYETEAVVLKSFALSEADKIISFFTREQGFVRLSVRGAKRLKSRFGGSLELFTVVDIQYAQKEDAELGYLREVEIIEGYFHLSKHLNLLKTFSYLGEILERGTPSHEPNEILFRLVRTCFSALAADCGADFAAIKALTIYFEIWLLRLSGVLPDFQNCSQCHRPVGAQPSRFRASEARLICYECSLEDRWGDELDDNLRRLMRAALSLSPSEFIARARLQTAILSDIQIITRRSLARLLEYEPAFWKDNWEFEAQVESDGDAFKTANSKSKIQNPKSYGV